MTGQDAVLSELIALRQAVSALNASVAVNTEATSGLQRAVTDVQQNAVPRREWELGRVADQEVVKGVAKDVKDLKDKNAADEGFRRNNKAMFAVAAFGSFSAGAIAVAQFVFGK